MIIITISSLLIYSELYDISVLAVYITTIFYSMFGSFSGISLTAALGNIIDPDRMQKAMSLNQMSVSIAAIAAPIIGGMLFGLVSIEVFLMIQIVAYTISTVLDSTMNFKLYTSMIEGTEQKKEKMLTSMKKAISYISTIQTLKSVMILSLWLNLFFSAISVGNSFILVELVKLKSVDVGWVEAVGAVGMLLASIYLTVRKKIERPLLFSKYALILMALSLVLLVVPLIIPFGSYTLLVLYYMVVFFISMITEICTNVPIGIVFQKTIAENYRGRVFALLETMGMAMMPIGSLLYGLLYDMIPVQYVILVTAGIIIALTLYMLRPSILNGMEREQAEISNVRIEKEQGNLAMDKG